MEIESLKVGSRHVIKIDGLIHIVYDADELCGIHAWMEKAEGPWFIDFVFSHNDGFSAEYDDEERWKAVLRELERSL